MKVPPRVRRVVEHEARFFTEGWTILGWAHTMGYYLVVYQSNPRPVNEESEVTQTRWIVFDKNERVHYSGIVSHKYDWRRNSDGD